ncbi:indole-3-glycerol phosphate synthase TrpC [Bacteroides sp. 51]|uniref:indole-3-glycerol phosphate synthase TrpC n=1 Tax=Bacteroides sp. 51 TaxID=2302938 RepID=UPI0013D6B835|nr:indole-3-glycerol phosphate synthase TrpC [Bacteroides sp. 51]NDV83580.1 indole-3-glycerol phosphate synthase TrpC [Bacteroides sp. 51]
MKTKDILSEIIENKRFEVDFQKRSIPLEDLQDRQQDVTPKLSMRKALGSSELLSHGNLAAVPCRRIIAEFKRRSPSKGWIKQHAKIEEIVPSYKKAGAAALSILTDEKFFGGTLMDLRTARSLVDIPILRKDFIINEYQLYQSKIVGADAILLIAAALEQEKCQELIEKAHQLGLEVLLEIHNESELPYITPQVDMVGINNRNLGTFHTTVDNSFRLAELLPQDTVLVSESGISNPETVKLLSDRGFRGFLIGETFMKTADPGKTLASFIDQLK